MKNSLVLLTVLTALWAQPAPAADKINVLLIDGQNNHNWKETSPVILDLLNKSGRFNVDVLTSPPKGAKDKSAWDKFQADFSKYQVVFSNYNGDNWPEAFNKGLEAFMENGGGLYIFHAANNAFPGWENWNKMIALGWRNNKFGDHVALDDEGKMVREPKGEGPGAGHGPQWAYPVRIRDAEHPVTKGMPATWVHAADELYHGQRGPGQNMHVLLTAYSDKAKKGTGLHECMVFTVSYGKGRVFVNLLGHAGKQTAHPGCAAFILRGTEWAATGKVTIPVSQELLELGKAAPAATPAPEPMGCDAAPGGCAGCANAPGATPAPDDVLKPVQGESFDAWRQPTGQWKMAGSAAMSSDDPKRLVSTAGTGVMINGEKGRTCDLLTAGEFGDVEVHVEFMVPKGSNSGVYFMGRYEVQVFDSFGKDPKTFSCADCGSIYQRWDPKRGKGKEGFDGHVPTINATREPGQWQSFDVIFRAPRFDADGKKTANAKFIKVALNDKVLHENVEATGPTRSAKFNDEKPAGPLQIQGDHGPVAYRNITIKPVKLD